MDEDRILLDIIFSSSDSDSDSETKTKRAPVRKKMTKVVSNKKQLCRLVELMEKNQDLAKGFCSKQIAQNKWKEFAKELNRLGPPEREWIKWQRVWSDLKVKVKKKQLQKILNSTRGGPQQQYLSASEETVVRLLDLEISSDSPKKEQESDYDIEMVVVNNSQNNISEIDEDNIPEPAQTKKSKIGNHALTLLEQQNNEQKLFYDNINKVLGDIRKSTKITELYTKKLFKLKEYKCKEILKIKRKKLLIYKQYVQNKKEKKY